MKRTIWMALAALLLAVPAANAQKVNESAFLAKIQKSDADIADAKKNIKASTWINRGKLFCDIAAEPTKNLFINMDAAMLKLAVGEPASTGSAEVGGQACETWEYPYFTAYIANNKLLTWKQKKAIVADAPAQAIEAYNKAYELDPKQGEKIKAGLKQVSDFCSQVGNAGLDSGDYIGAADAFAEAFRAQSGPAYGQPDPVLLYYAGYLRTIDGTSIRRSTWVMPTRRATSITTSSIVTTVRKPTIPLSSCVPRIRCWPVSRSSPRTSVSSTV